MIGRAGPRQRSTPNQSGGWLRQRPALRNPATWSVPLFKVLGVEWRIHAIFIGYLLIEMGRAIAWPGDEDDNLLGAGLTAIRLGCLVLVVALHECGHIVAGFATNDRLSESVLWPLGGLSASTASSWKKQMVISNGGLAVNLIVCAITTIWLGAATGEWVGVAIPSLFGPQNLVVIDSSIWWMTLHFISSASYTLLWFNLLPMLPLDASHVSQALFWPRLGYSTSMRWTINIGLITAVLLAILAAMLRHWWMGGVAAFGGICCYLAEQQLQLTDELLEPDSSSLPDQERRVPNETNDKPIPADEAADTVELDRILEKIALSGLGSLTAAERARLQSETDRRRKLGQGRRGD